MRACASASAPIPDPSAAYENRFSELGVHLLSYDELVENFMYVATSGRHRAHRTTSTFFLAQKVPPPTEELYSVVVNLLLKILSLTKVVIYTTAFYVGRKRALIPDDWRKMAAPAIRWSRIPYRRGLLKE